MHELLTGLLTEAGIEPVEDGVRTIQLRYDGALAGSKLSKSTAPIEHAKQLADRYISTPHRDS